MIADLSAKCGYKAVNKLMEDIHGKEIDMNKAPQMKKQFTELIDYIEENHRKKGELFSPQESMIRSWRGYNHSTL